MIAAFSRTSRPGGSARRVRHAVVAALLLAASAIGAFGAAETRPNIVFILADDLGYSDVGCFGSELPTPNIDRLAREGMRLTDYYSSSSCTPARFALMTGRHPNCSRDGLLAPLDVLDPKDAVRGIRPDETTIATVLKSRGYRTALVGKWHLGHGNKAFHPTRHGFDSFFGFTGGAIDFFTFRYGQMPALHRGDEVGEAHGYSTDLLTAEAARVIERQPAAEPLFLYLSYDAPHFGKPWSESAQKAVNALQAKPELLARFAHIADPQRRAFAAIMTSLDAGVGAVLAALERKGIAGNTLVVFTSDNGGAQNMGGTNRPFRGQKLTLFEGGIRVPCVVRWPGRIAAGTTSAVPTTCLDWFPTLARLATADLAASSHDGADLSPLLFGRSGFPNRGLFWHEIAAARDGGRATSAVRHGPWKLVHAPTGEELLFNLSRDPGEKTDLASRESGKVAELKNRLAEWKRSLSSTLR